MFPQILAGISDRRQIGENGYRNRQLEVPGGVGRDKRKVVRNA